MGLLALALAVFSGHAMAATLCNTGPTSLLGPPGTPGAPISGTVTGGLVVNAGALCLIVGANVSGGVQVNPGGVLFVCGSTINGGITANGAAQLIVGAEELPFCTGNTINGAVNISNTAGGDAFPNGPPSIAVENSFINGGVHLSGNQGHIAVAFNTIAGALSCSNNAFDLADEGASSLITGKVTCEFGEFESD
jgi:hypothetical protein